MATHRFELFTVRPLKFGGGYVVVYSPDRGLKEEIDDFDSEIAAVNWITISSAEWLKKRES